MKKEIVIQLSLLGTALVLMLLTVMCARTGGPKEVPDPALSQIIEGDTKAADEPTSRTKTLRRKSSAADAASQENRAEPSASAPEDGPPAPRPTARPRARVAQEETSF